MRKVYLITAILLLSAVWAVAQTTPSTPSTSQPATPDASSQTAPSSTSPSQSTPGSTSTTTQTTTTETTQTSNDSASSIEGCLNGTAGNFTLTDTAGKTWQLAGDTSKLSDHIGHQVRISGSDNSGSAGSASGSSANPSGSSTNPSSSASSGTGGSSASPSFTVRKVKMISSTCSTGSK